MKNQFYTCGIYRKTASALAWMLLVILAGIQPAHAQIGVTVSGTAVTTPALAGSYTSLANALNDLNAVTAYATPGTIVLTLSPGSETVPASGLTIGSSTLSPLLSATNTITLVKSSGTVTLNAGVGVATPASAVPDGILKLSGADFVTIDGLTFTDGNASVPSSMEYGLGFFKLSVTDGCNNNTVQNCVFNMQRINNATGTAPMVDGSVGIAVMNSTAAAATTPLTVTAASGTNSNNKFYSNIVNSGNNGIAIIGFAAASPFTFADQGNDIGGSTAATGNQILNYGGGAASNAANGVRTLAQYGLNVSYNIINNNTGTGSNHLTTLRGIYANTATSASETINNNTITVTCGATTSQLTAIENVAGSTAASNTVSINNNTIVTAYPTATTGVSYGVYNNGATPATLNVNGNTFTMSTAATSGSLYGIFQAGSVVTNCNTNNNNLSGVSCSAASTSLTYRGIYLSSAASTLNWTANNNNIGSVVFSGTYSGAFHFLYNSNTINSEAIGFNTLTNLNVPSTSTIQLFYLSNSTTNVTLNDNSIVTGFTNNVSSSSSFMVVYNFGSPSSNTINIFNNNFSNILVNRTSNTTAGSSSGQYGIFWATTTGVTQNLYNNTVSNFSNSGAGMIQGIFLGYGTNNSIYNNTVSNLNCAGPAIGLLCGNSSTVNMDVYNNTVTGITTTGASTAATGLQISTSAGSGPSGTMNIYGNKVCNVNATGATGVATGLLFNRALSAFLYNNRIGEITAPSSTSATAVAGINVATTSADNVRLYYNTVNLSGTSSGSGFGSSALFANTTPTIDARNNIFVNNTTATGTGKAAAYRRSSTTLTTYASSSNNNDWLGSTIFYDGTNTDLTLAAYQARVSTRDNLSLSTNPAFLSTACANATFLKINPATPTALESGATAITGMTADFEGEIRQGNAGYLGTGTFPDIGADEFNATSTNPYLCNGTPTAGIATGWAPLNVTGFNADVIANGVGPANTTTTAAADVDASPNYFLDATYRFDESSGAPAYSLPGSGLIRSASRPGLSYQLQNSSINNSLRLAGTGASGTLTLSSPQSAGAISLLATSGSGASTITVVVNFTDATNQTFAGLTVSDWFNGTPFAIQGISRVNSLNQFTGTGSLDGTNPRLYDVILTLSAANQSKNIASITVNKTSSGTEVLHVFAVSAASTSPLAACANSTAILTAYGPTAGLGISYQWKQSATPGGPYVNATGGSGANTTVYTTPAITSSTYYVLDVTCSVSGLSSRSNEVPLLINTVSVGVTSSAASICMPTGSTTLTATGATEYTWNPSTNLSPASGAVVVATPATTTTYTVTGKNNVGCTNTATTTVTVNPAIQVTASATPANLCSGGNSQLSSAATLKNVVSYSTASVPFVPITSGNNTVVLCNAGTAVTPMTSTTLDDGYWNGLALPFNFNFFGTTYSTFNVGTNGYISFSAITTTTGYGSSPQMPNTAVPNNMIGGCFGDLYWTSGGKISYYTAGSAPNRIFVVDFNGTPTPTSGGGFYNSGSAPTALTNFQIQLYENGNRIQVHTTSITADASHNHTMGVENSDGSAAVIVSGRNNSLWSLSNDGVEFVYGPVPATATYSWTPNTFISGLENTQNPLATGVNTSVNYTVTATHPQGCTATAIVRVESGTLTTNISGPSSICTGQSATLTANIPTGAGPHTYLWAPNGETTASINVNPSSTTVYSVTVTGSCDGPVTSAPFTLTVNSSPVLNLSSAYSTYCFGSVTPITLTASGNGTSYAWSPSTGLDVTNAATVHASGLTASQQYTVTSTLNGCSTSKTTYVKVPGPIYNFVTANPPAVCLGGASLLDASAKTTAAYLTSSETPAPVPTPVSGVTTLDKLTPLFNGNYNNGSFEVTLPFRFGFYNEGYNKIYINTNGYIGVPVNVSTPVALPSLTAPRPAIFLAWKDWTIASTGSIQYFTSGTAPNRVFVIKYVNVPPISGTGTLNGQIELNENGDIVMFLQSTDASSVKTLGIQAPDGVTFNSFSSRNGVAWTVSSPEMWKFTAQGGSFTYSWTPAADVFDPTAQNTPTNSLTALPETFTVVVQDTSGCSDTDTAQVTEGVGMIVNILPSPNDTVCAGDVVTLTAQVLGGGPPYTFAWDDGVNPIGSNSATIQVAPGLGLNSYNVVVTDQCNPSPGIGSIDLFVNPVPNVAVTPNPPATGGGAVACGADSAQLTASGNSVSYAWSPATGLSATTGSVVKALPAATSSYTVTGTNSFGCTTKVSIPVVKSFSVAVTATASPASICNGANSQLQAVASLVGSLTYSVSSVPFSMQTPVSPQSLTFSPSNDDGEAVVTIPFSFSFFGNSYSSLHVSSNGYVSFTDAATSLTSQTLPSTTTPNNVIALSWGDLNVITSSGSDVSVFTTGSAPNRIFVIQYSNVKWFTGSGGNVTGQIQLYEGLNAVEVHVQTVDHGTSTSLNVLGIENAGGTTGFTPPGRQRNVVWNVTTPEAWRFALPSTNIFSWTPLTFLSNATLPNPLATAVTTTTSYTVTATSSDGCKASASTKVTVAPLVIDSVVAVKNPVCQDSSVTLTAYPRGGGSPYSYAWLDNGSPVGTNNQTITVTPLTTGNHVYSVNVTDICGTPAVNGSASVFITPKPSVTVTSSNEICGSSSATLIASGANTYAWSPAATLSSPTADTVTATPTETTIYTVIGTSTLTGCKATATITQNVHLTPTLAATATPNPILLNANTQLNAVATQPFNGGYTVASIPFAPVAPTGPTTVLQNAGTAVTPLTSGSLDDGTWANINLPAGFAFNFFGQTKTAISISTNGFITFTSSNTASGCCSGQSLPNATTPNDVIAMGWEDWNQTAGTLDYYTTGVAPNRKFVVRAQNVPRFGGTGAPSTVMVVLNESSNIVDIHITSITTGSSDITTVGIENAAGTKGYAPAGRNALAGWSATNESWRFSPILPASPNFAYTWTPSTYLTATNIQNPMAVSVGGVITYTVNAINLTNGCSAPPAYIQVLAGVTLSVSITSPDPVLCVGESAVLNSVVNGGGVPYQYSWSDGTNVISTATSITVSPTVTTQYTLTITDVGNNTLASAPFEVTVNPLPVIGVTPQGGSICNGVPSTGIAMTATGADTYVWSPSTGLSSSTAASVTANPASSTNYVVTGTNTSTGCVNVSSAVTVNRAQLTNVATATPYSVCYGTDAQLKSVASNALANYTLSSIPYNLLSSASQTVVPYPSGSDDAEAIVSMPFNFNYYGNSYNSMHVSTNGYISFTDASTDRFAQTFPSTTTPNNVIAVCYSDLEVSGSSCTVCSPSSNITTFTVGSAPNRIFVVSFNNLVFFNDLTASNASGQIQLYESTGVVEIHLTGVNHSTSTSSNSLGIENANGTLGVTPPGRSAGVWNTGTPEAWRFSPGGGLNYSWSPGTFLNNKFIAEPVAQAVTSTVIYTSTVSEPVSGCTRQDTTIVNMIPLPTASVSGSTILCAGTSTNLSFTFTGTAPFTYTYTDGISTFGPLTSNSTTATVSVTPPGVPGEVITYTPASVSDARCTGSATSLTGSAVITLVSSSNLAGVTLTSNKPFNNICTGDNITLSLNGVTPSTLGYQAQWKWYRGGCGTGSGGTLIASNVTSITVTPAASATYYVRAEGYCNTTACLSLPVIVSTGPPSGNPTFSYTPVIAYAGASDSIVVNPVPGATWYRWTTGGNSNILFDGHPGPWQTTSNKVILTFIGPSTQGQGIGNYHISMFAGNACGRSNQNNVQIRSTVSAPTAIIGPDVACTGQTRTYSIAPIVGAKTYAWNFTSGSGTIVGNGTATVSVTFTSLPATLCVHGVTAFNSAGPDLCITITTNIASPGPVSGNTTPCQGTTQTYSIAPVVGAVSYAWSTTVPGATVSGTGTSASVTFPVGNFSGNVCVKANSGCGFSGNSCLAIVNGAPSPVGTIVGPTTGLCGVTSVNYQIPATGDTIYNWGVPAGATIVSGQGTNSILVNFSAGFSGGNITVQASNACGSVSGFLAVTGAPTAPSVSGSTSVCAGDAENYIANSPGATGYTFSLDSTLGQIVTTGNPDEILVIWLANGGTISVTASNGCGTSTATTYVVGAGACRLAGDQAMADVLKASVYPNPSNGHMTLQYNSPQKDTYLLKFTDLSGRIVYSETLSGVEGLNQHTLDMSTLAKGMYKLSIENEDGQSIVMKVVIE